MFRFQLGLIMAALTVKTALAAPPRPSAEDFYERLGVSRAATPQEITRAFRKAMLIYHQDRGGSVEDAQRLGEAYDALKRGRKPPRPQPPPWGFRPQPAPPGQAQREKRQSEARARRESYQASVYTQLSRHFQEERRTLRRADVVGSLILALRLARALIPAHNWEFPGTEQAGLDFFNDYVWVQMPAKSAAAFRTMFELWRDDGLPRALSRILLSSPTPADLRLVRTILDRREFFDPDEPYTAVPLGAWAEAVMELDRQSWGSPVLRQEFAPRFVALLHWRYLIEKNSRGLSRADERNGVPQTVRAYWRLYFGSWVMQKMRDWRHPRPPFPMEKDFCAANLKAR